MKEQTSTAGAPKPSSEPMLDDELLEMGLRLTPAQRLLWQEEAVEELLGLASQHA